MRAVARFVVGHFRAWRLRQRRLAAISELEALDDRLLADIGLGRATLPDAVDEHLQQR